MALLVHGIDDTMLNIDAAGIEAFEVIFSDR
jgi:hypothetical protein